MACCCGGLGGVFDGSDAAVPGSTVALASVAFVADGAITFFFKFSEKTGIFSNEVVHKIRRPKTPKLIPKALGKNDALELLTQSANFNKVPWRAKRDVAIITIIYGCGLRVSEALSLNKEDIIEGRPLTIKGKGGKERLVPLLNICVEKITQYLDECNFNLFNNFLTWLLLTISSLYIEECATYI